MKPLTGRVVAAVDLAAARDEPEQLFASTMIDLDEVLTGVCSVGAGRVGGQRQGGDGQTLKARGGRNRCVQGGGLTRGAAA